MNDHPCPECGLTGAHLVSCQTNMRHAVVFNAISRVLGAHYMVFVPLGARFEATTEALRALNDLPTGEQHQDVELATAWDEGHECCEIPYENHSNPYRTETP